MGKTCSPNENDNTHNAWTREDNTIKIKEKYFQNEDNHIEDEAREDAKTIGGTHCSQMVAHFLHGAHVRIQNRIETMLKRMLLFGTRRDYCR